MINLSANATQSATLNGSTSYYEKVRLVLFSFNVIVAITAFLGNLLILVVLQKESSLHASSKCLLRSLAFSDLCVGLIAQPALAVYQLLPFSSENDPITVIMDVLTFPLSVTLCSASLLTVIAISVDRLLALTLGLRYRHVVTLRRVKVVIILIWLLSIGSSLVYFWSVILSLVVTCVGVLVCIVTSTYCYSMIYLKLRHHRKQIQDIINLREPNEVSTAWNMERYSKTVSTALWVCATLLVCYLPYTVVVVALTNEKNNEHIWIALDYTTTIVYIGSSLNPVLYYWKIKEVRTAAKKLIKKLLCLFRH